MVRSKYCTDIFSPCQVLRKRKQCLSEGESHYYSGQLEYSAITKVKLSVTSTVPKRGLIVLFISKVVKKIVKSVPCPNKSAEFCVI